MKTFFTLIFCFILFKANAQQTQPWPYIKGVELISSTDTTGRIIKNYTNRNTYIYDTMGVIVSSLQEYNYAPAGQANFRPFMKDTFHFDNQHRLILQEEYKIDTGNTTKITPNYQYSYTYDDKERTEVYIVYSWDGSKWVGNWWRFRKKNIFNTDSFSATGNGEILFQNYSTKRIEYNATGKRPDSSVTKVYTNGQWDILNISIYDYSQKDTVKSDVFITKQRKHQTTAWEVKDSLDNVIYKEVKNSAALSHSINYFQFNIKNKLIENKTYAYDKGKKQIVLSAVRTYSYNSDNALLVFFTKHPANSIASNVRKAYTYTLRPKDPPKTDSLAAIYDPNPPISNFNKDTTTIGLSSQAQQDDFSIFPNPAKEKVFINTSYTAPRYVSLYNMDGKLIFSSQAATQPPFALDISGLNPGLYFLRLGNQNGNYFIKKLFIE